MTKIKTITGGTTNGMNRRSFLAALAAVQTFAALPALASGESIEGAIRNPAYRTVWKTVSHPDVTSEISEFEDVVRVLKNLKGRGHPISVTIVDADGAITRVHHNVRNSGFQEVALPWNGESVRYAVVYLPEYQINISEGDIVSLMRQRTDAYVGGKVIVVSRLAPPSCLKGVAHFRTS